MAVVVAAADADRAVAELDAAGESAYRIGTITARPAGEAPTLVA
jgi:phosphoribosylformylglycinamidine cyclo-ligase